MSRARVPRLAMLGGAAVGIGATLFAASCLLAIDYEKVAWLPDAGSDAAGGAAGTAGAAGAGGAAGSGGHAAGGGGGSEAAAGSGGTGG